MLCHQDPVGLDNVPLSMCLQKMAVFMYLLGIEISLRFLRFTNQCSNISLVFILKNTIATLCFTKTLNKTTFTEGKS